MSTPPTDPRAGLTTEEKRALLRQLLRTKIDPTSEPFPLTIGQRALWFLQQLVPDSFAYHIPIALRFTPPLDIATLRDALNTVVARHPALRTVIQDVSGTPRQHALPPSAVALDERPMPASDALLHDEVLAAYRRPFDLDRSLCRVTLWRGDTSDLLLFVMHHLVFDGRSALLLLHDLAVAYRDARERLPSSLTPIGATYRDFVTAQERILSSDAGAQLWSYWARQLAAPREDLSFPSPRPRPAMLTLRGDSIAFEIAPDELVRLKGVVQQQRTTLFSLIFTAVQVVLYQFTGQHDLVIGTPVSARTHPDWDTVIGYFVNMLPIRAPLSADRSFAEQLRQVHRQLMDGIAHQEFPFPAMVERLNVTRDPGRTPVFQVIVNLTQATQRLTDTTARIDALDARAMFGGSSPEPYRFPQLEGQFEIAVELSEEDHRLRGAWKFSTDVLDYETAARMLHAFRGLLRVVCERPETPIHALLDTPNADREDLTF